MLLIIGLAVWYCCFCKESAHEGPGYTVAMSNRLFKVTLIVIKYPLIKYIYIYIYNWDNDTFIFNNFELM
jgi:hypothetical protein